MPRDGSATRRRILDAAERLVIENGFAATSVDRVIEAADTSKGAFFHHFESKRVLASALVERYAAADIAHLDQAVAVVVAATQNPVERVVHFVRLFEESAEELMASQSSCLYVAALAEQQLIEAGTTQQIAGAILAWRSELSRLLQAAIAVRPAAHELDPGALADHVFVTFEGAFLLSRSMSDSTHMRSQLKILRQLLEALLHQPSETA